MVSTALTGCTWVVLRIFDSYDCFERGFLGFLDSFESVDTFLREEGWRAGRWTVLTVLREVFWVLGQC